MTGEFLLRNLLKAVLFNKVRGLVPAVHVNVDIVSNSKSHALYFPISLQILIHAWIHTAHRCTSIHRYTKTYIQPYNSSWYSSFLSSLPSTYLTSIFCILQPSQLLLSSQCSLHRLWPFLHWNRILPNSIFLMHKWSVVSWGHLSDSQPVRCSPTSKDGAQPEPNSATFPVIHREMQINSYR